MTIKTIIFTTRLNRIFKELEKIGVPKNDIDELLLKGFRDINGTVTHDQLLDSLTQFDQDISNLEVKVKGSQQGTSKEHIAQLKTYAVDQKKELNHRIFPSLHPNKSANQKIVAAFNSILTERNVLPYQQR